MVGNGSSVLRRSRERGLLAAMLFMMLPLPLTGLTQRAEDSSGARDDLDECVYSEQILSHDSAFNQYHGSKLLSDQALTYIPLMASRFVQLREALRGLNCSGVPLVAFDGWVRRPCVSSWFGQPSGIIAKRDLFLRERTVNQLLLTYHHPLYLFTS